MEGRTAATAVAVAADVAVGGRRGRRLRNQSCD